MTFFVGFLGSLLSSTSGAGAGLLTSPFFLFIGLPPQAAIGTAKVGGVGLTLACFIRFRNTEHIRKEFVRPFIIVSGISAVLGMILLVHLPEEPVRIIIGSGVLIALPFLFIKKSGLERKETTLRQRRVGWTLKLFSESAQAAFGSGLGVLTSLVVIFFFGFTALEANATKRIPGLVKECCTLPFLFCFGFISYYHGLALFLGSLAGGLLGAELAIKKGNPFVKFWLAVVVAITGIMILIK